MAKSPWGLPRAARLENQRSPVQLQLALPEIDPEPASIVCRICSRELPVEAFPTLQGFWHGRQCRACQKKRKRDWGAAFASARYGAHLRRTYKLSLEEYARMFAQQDGRCAICHRRERILNKRGEPRHLHVDHDHRTGQRSDLLCSGCNAGLGGFGDDLALLEAAIRSLRSHAKPNGSREPSVPDAEP
jgi:hypothetical protein